MGIGNAISSAAVSYLGNFRFQADAGNGQTLGESFVPILGLITPGNPGGMMWVGKSDDQAILLQMLIVRQQKNTALFLKNIESSTFDGLATLAASRAPFFVAIAVQKNVWGKRVEIHILRDQAARLTQPPSPDNFNNQRMWTLKLAFSSPKVLHGVGQGYDFKPV